MTDYLNLAQEAYDASSTYMDSNWRADWDYSIKAFRNEHASGSKYLSDDYKARSRLFPPHTRTIIRKNEAAAMQAAFSNRELVVVEPGNPDDLMAVASAAALKEVIEYRLSRTLPTYEIYLGGIQDAQTTGTVCSYQYWEYEKRGEKVVKDKPCIELRPIENIRLDAGASWLDPVNSSPYFCDIIPMYVCDVRAMMEKEDDKTGMKWKKFDDEIILKARPDVMDSTRRARLGKNQDPHDETTGIKSFDVVWVMRWFMRDSQGQDQTFYTLGTEELLTEAKPVEEVYFHGVRPYVIGYSVLETHRVLKSGLPILTKQLQQESAEITNQRIDNVKFVLNKRWIVARGRQVDVQSLVRNVPGGVTLTTDPNNDIKESNWPDVTSSAFVEQDRIKSAFDELAGNFSPSTKVANNAVNDTLGGSRMAASSAGLMSDYLIRTVNETWWEKVLRQLALLEQYYETDEVVLAVCAQKAQLFPRFGISKITDMLLMKEVTVSVDMAMGDPRERLQRFLAATNAAMQIRLNPAPGANVSEMTKEIYCNAGYRDGARFFGDKQDPALMKAMQAIQQLQQALNGKQMELQAGLQETQLKLVSSEKIKAAELQVDRGRIEGDLALRQADLVVEQQKVELERLKLQIEQQKAQVDAVRVDLEMRGQSEEHAVRLREIDATVAAAEMKLEEQRKKLEAQELKIAAESEKAQLELQTARDEANNAQRFSDMAGSVSDSVSTVSSEISAIKQALQASQSDVQRLGQGLGVLAQMVTNKRKPKGFSLKKPDGKKTSSVVVSYDDGSVEEMAVN